LRQISSLVYPKIQRRQVITNVLHPSCASPPVLRRSKLSNKCIAVRKVATPLRELTCHMGSHSVTCHPAEVAFPLSPEPKLVLD